MIQRNGIGRKRRRALWAIGLGASVAVNFVLIVKILIFDSNRPFRPICFEHGAPLGIIDLEPWDNGIREIDGPQTAWFQEKARFELSLLGYRLGKDERIYISNLDRYRYEDDPLKATRYAVKAVIQEHAPELDLPPMSEYENLSGKRRIDCDLIRRVAIE